MNAPLSLPLRVAGSRSVLRSPTEALVSRSLVWSVCFHRIAGCLLLYGLAAAFQPLLSNAQEPERPHTDTQQASPTRFEEQIVRQSFATTHDGWSVDEVLLRDDLREAFVSECRKLSSPKLESTHDRFCATLLHVRKRGGQLPRATRRERSQSSAAIDALAEIAARRVHDEFLEHTDALLVNSQVRDYFDALIRELAPEADLYVYRKAALKLRKTRRLNPELLTRVTDWKKEILDFAISNLSPELAEIPKRPGIYIFRDATGYLYIGQASDLRVRLRSHLNDSDRLALAEYLSERSKAKLTSSSQPAEEVTQSTDSPRSTDSRASTWLEVHVFKSGSPAENLGIRRAYESELIRTRKPRFNIAP
jgi:hypothetical protein